MKILFVCIGNTCRSPMAESVMKHYIDENNLPWEVDSAGLRSWNVGYAPEERCIRVLAENGLSTQHVGREISLDDFKRFDYICGMDECNMDELRALSDQVDAEKKAKIELLGSYIGRKDDEIIDDPYFSTVIGGFRCAYSQIDESCRVFVQKHK